MIGLMTAAQHVAEITAALKAGTRMLNLGTYDSRLDGAKIFYDYPCIAPSVPIPSCDVCHGLGYTIAVNLTPQDARVTFYESTLDEQVLALVIFAEEILNSELYVSDPVVVAEHCEDWRDEQHLRDLIRYWSSRLAVGEFDQTDEAALVEAANELPVDQRQHLLPQHQRALLLDAAALLLEGHEDLRFEGERLRKLAQDALEEGR